MRREQFTLDVTNVAWINGDYAPEMPCLRITFDGEPAALRSRLTDAHGEANNASEIDVTVRLQGDVDADETAGVVAITSRVTGDYLLEVQIDATAVVTFTRAARRFGERSEGTSRYRVQLFADGEAVGDYEKRTLLVYSKDGDLLRHHSLIPSGVEI
jgi:hypothetical protein